MDAKFQAAGSEHGAMIDLVDVVTLALPVTVPQTTRLRLASGMQTHAVVLTQDLCEDWIVMESWDGRPNQRGGGKIRRVENFEAGMAALDAIKKTRVRRGFQVVD